MKILNYSLILFSFILIFSCTTRKEIVYVQGIDKDSSFSAVKNYESTFQPDDVIKIQVTATDVQAVAPFNQAGVSDGGEVSGVENSGITQGISYTLDKDGNFEMPVLGKINLLGKTRTEAISYLQDRLKPYVKDAIVLLTNQNSKVTFLGEIGSPGTRTIPSERLTILEGIALAGDLKITGKRDNILIIRDQDGVKTHARVNLLDPNIINSEYYYLKKNDVVYVEPSQKTIQGADNFRTNLPFILGMTSSIISLVLILTRL